MVQADTTGKAALGESTSLSDEELIDLEVLVSRRRSDMYGALVVIPPLVPAAWCFIDASARSLGNERLR
jgi:hypothetical protein